MDKFLSTIVGMGVPGLVYVIAIATVGVGGGAAIAVTLAALGGPFGMVGGIGLLVTTGLISKMLAEYGIEYLVLRLVKEYRARGTSKEEILRKVESYPIGKGLKRAIRELLVNID